MKNQIACPHCKEIQSDCTNGGDPRSWWGSEYIPYGECEVDCDSCGKEFTVICNWEPNFTVLGAED